MVSSSAFRAAVLSPLRFSLKNQNILPTNVAITNTIDRSILEVLNPGARKTDDPVIARIKYMEKDDAKKIVTISSEALPSWRDSTTGLQRSLLLQKWSNLMKENANDLALIMTMESGKPLTESLGEISYAASYLDFYAGECVRPSSAGGGQVIPTTFKSPDGRPRGKQMALKEAIGVTALITPWNFPMAMITRKVGPALAAGCTAVVKPSELTPLSAIALKALADESGIPPGVFELIISAQSNTPEIGQELCENPLIRKLSFTGSTPVGKLLMKQSSNTVKKLSLELGGNAPFIVFEDADIDQAVQAAMASKFRNAGQTCVCADRFLVHESVEELFITKLINEVKKLNVGPGTLAETTMGPLITEKAVLSVEEKVQEVLMKSNSAECVLGGSRLTNIGANFFEPTIIRNVDVNSRLWNSETFGPVVAIRSFDTEDEALSIANDTPTGLASYFCTKDLNRIFRVAGRLENGIIGINDGIISSPMAPFGGIKESGLGREGSSIGIEEYLETKYVFLNA